MIAAWMFTATLFCVLLAVAATAAERALRLLGRPVRGAWIVALAQRINDHGNIRRRQDHEGAMRPNAPKLRVGLVSHRRTCSHSRPGWRGDGPANRREKYSWRRAVDRLDQPIRARRERPWHTP